MIARSAGWAVHPVAPLTILIDCGVGAWLGHDGFQWPGNCDYYHQLHHKYFDCNYGNPHFPLDWFFGTYAGCMEDLALIFGRKVEYDEQTGQELVDQIKQVKQKKKN